jgi:hypothetical protein
LTDPGTCPLCGQPLYGWIALPPLAGGPAGAIDRVIDRCESCGAAVERGREVDLVAEWEAICRPAEEGARAVAVPDRASLQAAIGVDGWAAIDVAPGHLLLTRTSLALLAERNGHRLDRLHWRVWGRNQTWMWQTLLNGLTFHPNFAREVRAGRLRPANARSRFAFGADLVVTVLGAPLVALVSFPLETLAALLRRGGELTAVARTL